MHTQRRTLSVRSSLGVLAVTGLLATAACGTQSGDDRSSPGSDSVGTRKAAPITGKYWSVRSVTVDGKEHDAPAGAYIRFAEDGTVGGNYGCNHFGADVRIKGDTIRIGDAFKTEMACTDAAAMAFENRLGSAVSGSTLKAEADGDGLTLTAPDGSTVNLEEEKPAELVGTRWNVTSRVKSGSAVPLTEEAKDDVELTFGKDGTVRGRLGCNRVTAEATVGDDSIALGRAATTRKMCSPSLMETERALLKLFDGTVKYQVKHRTLTLTSENGTGLEAAAAR
ncbi:META domain-containing protein [Streptomyces fructofermentans]|uniref:Lipoprotein n=1 Tax=Streptomyces fructofermentans TaxID=152141 RepID=A0A918NSI2_9ACTN|nr:META domain-containing protein [Streptomyces fructofermentans]GGX91358.1 lipoprotein [Streptomyces fructofermentans]